MHDYLSRRIRFLNWLIDTLLSLLLFVIAVRLLVPANSITASQSRMLKYVFLLFNFLYYLVFEALLGKTPAKYITRTVLNSDHEGGLKFTQILIRSLSRYIPLEPLFIFFRDDKKSLHDVLSNTQLIKIK
jgi:uncharacterized RDD family membrane protein YckC